MPARRKQGQKVRGVFWRGDRNEWWIRWTCTLGHKHRQAIGADKEEAKRDRGDRVMKVRAARRAGQILCPNLEPRSERPVLFAELLDEYLRRRDLRARDEEERALRRRKERARVEYLRSRFGSHPVVSITARNVEAVYEDLRGHTVGKGDDARPVAVATVNRYMKLLHAVLRLGVKRGLLVTNPASSVELARENNARNRCLSDDEESALTNALPAWLRPLVTVAMHTGMRRGELLSLRWDDVDLVSRQLRIRRDKAGDGRWVALNSMAISALLVAKRRKVTSPLVFCTLEGHSLTTNFKRYWQAAVKVAGITGFRFHDCRHTFASRLVNAGVDRYAVQAAGGWKTASMMQRYAHLEPATIRAAVERLVQRPSSANGHQNGHQPGHQADRASGATSITA